MPSWEEAERMIAAKEQEHQDFRLQNDSEWRAKLDHLKAQIAAKDEYVRNMSSLVFKAREELADAKEQIAAKDVQLASVRAFPTMLRKMWSGGEVQQWIDHALTPPAQEK